MAISPALPQQIETFSGLTANEVQERIKRGESNDYKARVSRSYWDIFRDNVLNLFNIVLFTLLFIVLLFGDYGTVFFAGFSVLTNTLLGAIQEASAKRRLDKLATLSAQKVIVWRDGIKQEIQTAEVVKDDLLVIEPGTKAVVDGVVVKSDSLEMDESLLTGESDAVFKDSDNEIYSGSFCVAGVGIVKATKVGKESTINKLSVVAKEYKRRRTPTQKRIDIVVEISVVLMFLFMPMVFISNLIVADPALPYLQALRNAVVFETTLVPQGLVLTAILSLTIGAIKISRHQTLIQRVNAVESLANVTVLCFDKTGTLTQNKLAVDDIIPFNGSSLPDVEQQLADYLAHLAHRNRTAGAVETHVKESTQVRDIQKIKELPFTSGRKWGAIQFEHGAFVMGAPERLIDENADALRQSDKLSERGMRVLAFGKLANLPTDDHIVGQVELIALIVLSDQVRENIHETLQAFRDENIRLKVISGDNLQTVQAIARQSGMKRIEAYTGQQLDKMNDAELRGVVKTANVFARIEPDTKRRVITALQENREYVAMVGDGVNDVPALKQANLAIVMNDGTQISKDIADIVLLNNALSTLPRAFAEGTQITQTIFGTTKLFLIRGFSHIFFFIYIMFMGMPFPITPIQISWATFGSINIPAGLLAIGFIRPKFMKNFRHDVFDHVVTGSFLYSIMMLTLFTATYFGSDRQTDLAQSALALFIVVFNTVIVMMIQGVDFLHPRTILEHWRVCLFVTVFSAATVVLMYISPDTFEFTPVLDPLWIVFVFVLAVLGIVLFTYGLRYRYLLHRLWALLSVSDDQLTDTMPD